MVTIIIYDLETMMGIKLDDETKEKLDILNSTNTLVLK